MVQALMCKDVRSCLPGHTLTDAARIMCGADCGCVPVVDENGRICGILTDRDICMAAYLRARPPQEIRVEEVMARQVLVCRPGEHLAAAEATMRRAQVRRLPVVDAEGSLVGILSLNDIATEAERSRRGRWPEVTLDEVGLTLSAVGHRRLADNAHPIQP